MEFTRMSPTPLEQLEKLEQLRILEHGYSIQVEITEKVSMGVDQVEDLEKIERLRMLTATLKMTYGSCQAVPRKRVNRS